ncbi:S1 RNA-binding domain-containing protein [Litorilinea aerophila]|nr:S1 RNA-binding domain-containing protein [Litorilinea aerophila]MCC9075873.1 S1 RNA-binding domain-containing protein [Litorilinea aerophila]
MAPYAAGSTQGADSAHGFHTPDGDVHPMALLLDEIEQTLAEPQTGEIRKGIIVDKRPNEILVDIGFKSEGIVSGRELDRIRDMLDSLEVGAEVPVYVLREDRDGNLLLSISRAQAEKDWERAEALMQSQEIFESPVAAYNRGGVIVKLGQVRGFVPASQLSAESQSQSDPEAEDAEERWAKLVGERLMLKVIDIDRRRNRLILSERQAVREWRRQQKDLLLETLKEGDVYEGVISSLADFGAFVDLGGADGLIHLSELSWNRVSHPSEVVSVGDKVKVQILSVDRERRRIGLSLRRLQPEPWDLVNENYEVGQIVRGRITKLVNFGAFARLEKDGIEGLIHISELADRRVNHPKEVVAEGEEYDLRIIRIDTDRRRMGLSLKQATPPSTNEVELDWTIAPSQEADGNASSNGQVSQASV